MDLLEVLPGFATKNFAHIIPPLERARVTTVDVITLDALEIAKRARVPPGDVRRLSSHITEALHIDLGFDRPHTDIDISSDAPSSSINPDGASLTLDPATKRGPSQWSTISTLDPAMDSLLGGGIPTGYITEVTGESGSGKTQFLLNLSLAVQLQKPRGLGRRAIYISTEHPLSTPRLSQILECHPVLSTLPVEEAPSLQGVLSINAMDMETQDHILNFHLPVAIERYNVGLVIIDSITSNYRAEYQNDKDAMTNRSTHLARLGHFLRNLAVKHDIAIVLANQVSDRFEQANPDRLATQAEFPYSQSEAAGEESGPASPKFRTELLASELGTQIPPSSPGLPSSPHNTPDQQAHGSYQVPQPHNEKLDMELQERFFTGWGDDYLESESRKNPALGFIWTTQIACRIALKKQQHASGTDEHSTSPVPVTVTTPGSPSQTHYHGDPTTFEDQDSIAMPAPVPNRVSDTQDHRPALGSDLVKGRTMKLVFSPWTAGSEDHSGEEEETERSDEVEFEIWEGGLRSTNHVD